MCVDLVYIEASVPPDCRSARNNLHSGIPHVSSGLDLDLLPVQCFPLLPVRISDSDLHSGPRFRLPFRFPFWIPFRFPFRFPFRIPFRLPFRFPFRFPFRIPFRFLFRFTYRILFHDPRFSTDTRSGSRSGSRSGFRFCLAFLPAAPPAASRFAPARRCFIKKAVLDHGQSLG